jgi:SAM-dependent methyltransferase
MGEGHHALLLAAEGFTVIGVDRNADTVARVRARARARGLTLDARTLDLETEGLSPLLGGGREAGGGEPLSGSPFTLIVNVHYLQRDLLPALENSLAPGGWILFETFTRAHPRVSRSGRPANPDFLLRPGELRRAFGGLEIVSYEEGVFTTGDGDRKAVARMAAFRPNLAHAP